MSQTLNVRKRHPILTCFSTATVDLISIFLAEFTGTFVLLLAGCSSTVLWNGAMPLGLLNPFNFGMVMMIIIQCFATTSGAIFNPAMSLAAAIYGVLSIRMAILYSIAQIVGGVVGFGILKLVTPTAFFSTPEGVAGCCSTVPHDELKLYQAILIEFFATMVLVFVSCSVWDPRNARNSDSAAIRLGLTVTGLSLAFGSYTGCSMNPARSFAPALWNNDWKMHWIYWFVPVAASVFTTYTYKIIFWKTDDLIIGQNHSNHI